MLLFYDGVRWEQGRSATQAPLRGIDLLAPGYGWAVGLDGTILRRGYPHQIPTLTPALTPVATTTATVVNTQTATVTGTATSTRIPVMLPTYTATSTATLTRSPGPAPSPTKQPPLTQSHSQTNRGVCPNSKRVTSATQPAHTRRCDDHSSPKNPYNLFVSTIL